MNDDFKKLIYRVVAGFVVLIAVFVTFTFLWSCGLDFACKKADPVVARTPIPTLPAAHLVSAPQTDGAGEFNKCEVRAVDLVGAWVDAGAPEADAFGFTDVHGIPCQATFEADIFPLLNETQVWFTGALSCTSCHNSALDAKRSGGLDLSSYAAIRAGSGRETVDVAQGADILASSWTASKLYAMFNPAAEVTFGHPTLEEANTLIVFAGSPAPQPEATPAP